MHVEVITRGNTVSLSGQDAQDTEDRSRPTTTPKISEERKIDEFSPFHLVRVLLSQVFCTTSSRRAVGGGSAAASADRVRLGCTNEFAPNVSSI